jgi:hypothetical protein
MAGLLSRPPKNTASRNEVVGHASVPYLLSFIMH